MVTSNAGTGLGSEVVSVPLMMWNVISLVPRVRSPTSVIWRGGGGGGEGGGEGGGGEEDEEEGAGEEKGGGEDEGEEKWKSTSYNIEFIIPVV